MLCDLENEVKVTKYNPFVPIMCLCQFGQNHPLIQKIQCRQEIMRTLTNLTKKCWCDFENEVKVTKI